MTDEDKVVWIREILYWESDPTEALEQIRQVLNTPKRRAKNAPSD